MEIVYQTHIDREIESLIERIHPPRVCIDNDSCRDSTVVKIDSANRHGILLEMVQVLTDLDLIISKSYISSDGGWLMDVFHVTDQVGNKLTDKSLVHHIQQALCEARSSKEISSDIDLQKVSASEVNLAIELTTTDQPGLFSEISAVLFSLGFNVSSATAWTHNHRMACIIHLEDSNNTGPIYDAERLGQVQAQLQNTMKAHDGNREEVRLRSFAAGRNHTERRLHQMMYADGDYERCNGDTSCENKNKECERTKVSVGRYQENGYWVVNVTSKDRPKLLFDTVCVLTDMHYEVFHASVSSNSFMADQEYFVKPKGSSNLDYESERQKLTLCLIAAIERRVSHVCSISSTTTKGLKVDIRAENRRGLLSKVTRVIRENGLSITRVEIGVEGETAVGSFYVEDCSGQDVNPNIAELVRRETGGSVVANYTCPYRVPGPLSSSSSNRSTMHETMSNTQVIRPRFSLGSMLWSQLECLSNNFRPIRS